MRGSQYDSAFGFWRPNFKHCSSPQDKNKSSQIPFEFKRDAVNVVHAADEATLNVEYSHWYRQRTQTCFCSKALVDNCFAILDLFWITLSQSLTERIDYCYRGRRAANLMQNKNQSHVATMPLATTGTVQALKCSASNIGTTTICDYRIQPHSINMQSCATLRQSHNLPVSLHRWPLGRSILF